MIIDLQSSLLIKVAASRRFPAKDEKVSSKRCQPKPLQGFYGESGRIQGVECSWSQCFKQEPPCTLVCRSHSFSPAAHEPETSETSWTKRTQKDLSIYLSIYLSVYLSVCLSIRFLFQDSVLLMHSRKAPPALKRFGVCVARVYPGEEPART